MADAAARGTARLAKVMAAVAALAMVFWFIYAIRAVLPPFAVAFVLAYVLAPVVDYLEGRGLRRAYGISLVFTVLFGGLAALLGLAGGVVVDDVRGLVDSLLQPESVERELPLSNRGTQVLGVVARWEPEEATRRFALPVQGDVPLSLGPGRSETLRVRFAPPDTNLAVAVLQLETAGQPPVRVRLRGNGSGGSGGDAELRFWREEAARRQHEGDLVVGAAGLDFGRAGPNLITRLGEQARVLQPRLAPFVGADFDLGAFIARQGRVLIDEQLLGRSHQVLGGVFSGITFVALVPFIAFFFLSDGRRLTRAAIRLVPNAYFELCLNLLHQVNGQIGGYIRGQVIECGVVAALSVTALLWVGVEYAVPLGVLAGLANVIPYLGPAIGIVSASMVALSGGAGFEVIAKIVVVFAVVQFIDNMLVQPAVLARSVAMHPLLVLFVVMVGSELLGIVGMLIAVPLAGVIKVSVRTVYLGWRGYRPEEARS